MAAGRPIATGVIEGACRHLIGDRLDITGTRWGLDGAEAVLTLRAVISNGDFDEYWRYPLTQHNDHMVAIGELPGYKIADVPPVAGTRPGKPAGDRHTGRR